MLLGWGLTALATKSVPVTQCRQLNVESPTPGSKLIRLSTRAFPIAQVLRSLSVRTNVVERFSSTILLYKAKLFMLLRSNDANVVPCTNRRRFIRVLAKCWIRFSTSRKPVVLPGISAQVPALSDVPITSPGSRYFFRFHICRAADAKDIRAQPRLRFPIQHARLEA